MVNNLPKLLLILVIFILALTVKTLAPRLNPAVSPYANVVKNVDSKAIDRLTLSKKGEKVELVKEADIWKVGGKKADRQKVEKLIKSLLGYEGVQLVAQTDARHKEFGVTSDEATEVKVGDTMTFLVGTDSVSGAYVRSGTNDVYLVPDLSQSYLSTTPAFWIDTKLISLSSDQFTKVTLSWNNQDISVSKTDGKWVLDNEKKEVKSDIWNPIIEKLATLNADSVANETDIKEYSTKPQLSLTVYGSDKSEKLTFYKGENNDLVMRSLDTARLVITENKVQELLIDPKKLI